MRIADREIEDSCQDATGLPLDDVALIVRANGEVELAIPKDEVLEWHPTQMALAQLAIRSTWIFPNGVPYCHIAQRVKILG